ncbi:hypothetical protein [Saccharopolyspora phatthalungensis]|uniref:hypothetical protein n=1 Tax=Saccharopolyspora phatthalungensis TaxID=664693 RepID=UPI001FE7CEC0|nr:hypothetical protein [Saccharopolyspora phatthalungensis]
MELPEGLTEVAVGDLLVFDVEAVEDRLVEQAALLLGAAPVQLVGVFEELEAGLDEPGAVGEVGAGGVQAAGEVFALAFDVAQLGFDLGLRQGAVGGQVDQVFLLGIEFGELTG